MCGKAARLCPEADPDEPPVAERPGKEEPAACAKSFTVHLLATRSSKTQLKTRCTSQRVGGTMPLSIEDAKHCDRGTELIQETSHLLEGN